MLGKSYRHTAVCLTANVFSVNDCLEHPYTAEASGVKARRISVEISTEILSCRRKVREEFSFALRENGKNLVEGRILNIMFITKYPRYILLYKFEEEYAE